MYSQLMDRGVQGVPAQVEEGCCTWCRLPAAICARWQWNKGQEEWEEDKETRCQYEGVLMPAMVATIELGKEEGAKRVQGLGWASGEWVSKRIWWGRVEVRQVVVVFMMLARMNDVLQVVCKGGDS